MSSSTPEAEGISSEVVLGLVSALDTQVQEPHSLMLVRHGKVVERLVTPADVGR